MGSRGAISAFTLLALLLISACPQALAAPSTMLASPLASSQNCLNGGSSGSRVPLNASVAVIKPVFTSTPYSQYPSGSFYAFYKKYTHAAGNITTNLGWLSTSVKFGMSYLNGWGHTFPLFQFLSSPSAISCGLVLGKNLAVISDINVTQGALFNPDGSRRFDAVVIGHQEYVTQAEYDQLRLFVASGGRLVAMSSNMFYARVDYAPSTLLETFVVGHGGYNFNGRTAWFGNAAPFARNSSGWLGSNYCCFHRFNYTGGVVDASNPVGSMLKQYVGGALAPAYRTHEENAVANLTRTSIVATFTRQSGLVVASYIHQYGRGAVFCLCIFGEDFIASDPSTQYFLVASLAVPLSAVFGALQTTGPSYSLPTSALIGLVVAAVSVPTIFLWWRRAYHKGQR